MGGMKESLLEEAVLQCRNKAELFVPKQTLCLFTVPSTVIASNILLVDEIMRAGMSSLKG